MKNEIESHLAFIDLSIENNILFVEDNLNYSFKLPNGKLAVYFLRTEQLMVNGKPVKINPDDLINSLTII
jgi:hypothetical protein